MGIKTKDNLVVMHYKLRFVRFKDVWDVVLEKNEDLKPNFNAISISLPKRMGYIKAFNIRNGKVVDGSMFVRIGRFRKRIMVDVRDTFNRPTTKRFLLR